MELKARIDNDLKQASRARDQLRLVVLRSVTNAIHNLAISQKPPGVALAEADWLKILRSEIKKRQEAKGLYQRGGRQELAEREQAEIEVLEPYLPAAPPPEVISNQAAKFKQELGLVGAPDVGRLTKALLEHFAGAVTGKQAQQAALRALGGLTS